MHPARTFNHFKPIEIISTKELCNLLLITRFLDRLDKTFSDNALILSADLTLSVQRLNLAQW